MSTSPQESSIVHQAEAPEAAPAAAVKALAGLEPRWSEHRGDVAVLVEKGRFFNAVKALKDEAGFGFFVDHTAVDYPERDPRFTVVAILMNLDTQDRLIVKTHVAQDEPVQSLTPLWNAANWAERETYDMFGIPFEGHPELTRIYLPASFEGWPLRRDFPLQGHLRFKD